MKASKIVLPEWLAGLVWQLWAFAQTSTGLLVLAGAGLVFTLAWCRLFSRVGLHGALGLLMLVPVVNAVMFLVLAFGRWPVASEARALRRVQRAARDAEDRHYRKAV